MRLTVAGAEKQPPSSVGLFASRAPHRPNPIALSALVSYHVMFCYIVLCYDMLCYDMLCYVMLCYVMICYVIMCYDMLYYVMV